MANKPAKLDDNNENESKALKVTLNLLLSALVAGIGAAGLAWMVGADTRAKISSAVGAGLAAFVQHLRKSPIR